MMIAPVAAAPAEPTSAQMSDRRFLSGQGTSPPPGPRCRLHPPSIPPSWASPASPTLIRPPIPPPARPSSPTQDQQDTIQNPYRTPAQLNALYPKPSGPCISARTSLLPPERSGYKPLHYRKVSQFGRVIDGRRQGTGLSPALGPVESRAMAGGTAGETAGPTYSPRRSGMSAST